MAISIFLSTYLFYLFNIWRTWYLDPFIEGPDLLILPAEIRSIAQDFFL